MKYSNLKKTVLVALVSFNISLTPLLSIAEEDLDGKLTTIQEQMDAEANKRADAEARIGTFTEQLHQIQQELDVAAAELKDIEKQRIATEQEIAKNEKLLREAEARLTAREKVLHKRVRDIYINGRLSYLDVIIGAKNFNDFANRLEILKRIIDADISLLNEIKAAHLLIVEKKNKLEEDRARILVLQKEAEVKKAEVEKKKEEQQILLDKATQERETAMQAYAELEAASNEIREMIRNRQQQMNNSGEYPPVQGTGQFIWPVSGPITSPFGYRTHPIFGTTIYHSGLDIGVDEGTPVHAADSGVVTYSGWLGGYGYAVIIDHGGATSSLYAHNSDLAVSEGQIVSKGQVICYAGSTGYSTGPHVHFEVRVNGDPVDPMGYL